MNLRLIKIAVVMCTYIFPLLSSAQTAANLKKCLNALNNHKVLKFSQLTDVELKKLNDLSYGLSNNELALFILISGKDINENCPQNVTEYFVGKFDSSFILNVKRIAAQGNCPSLDACNKRAREFEGIIKALNGGSAGLARANLADSRYTNQSSTGAFESAAYSVCCSGPLGGKVNAGPGGGGYCEKNETIYPCFANTSDPLKDNDPGRAAFYKTFDKQRQLNDWISKYGGGTLSKPARGLAAPASSPALGVGR